MPGVVKGSKQKRMVVAPYRPWLRYALLAGVLLAATVGFILGQIAAGRDDVITSRDNEQLVIEL